GPGHAHRVRRSSTQTPVRSLSLVRHPVAGSPTLPCVGAWAGRGMVPVHRGTGPPPLLPRSAGSAPRCTPSPPWPCVSGLPFLLWSGALSAADPPPAAAARSPSGPRSPPPLRLPPPVAVG